jgi:hypothetical protein
MEKFIRNMETNLGGKLFSTKCNVTYAQMVWQLLTSAVKHISQSMEDMTNVATKTDLAADDSRTKYTMNERKMIINQNKLE